MVGILNGDTDSLPLTLSKYTSYISLLQNINFVWFDRKFLPEETEKNEALGEENVFRCNLYL